MWKKLGVIGRIVVRALIGVSCVYLLGCLAGWTFNMGDWHWVLRAIDILAMIGMVVVMVLFSAYVEN